MTTPSRSHTDLAASPWVRRWSHLVPAGARVLDVACGSGRHVDWFVQRGCTVTGLDRDAAAVSPLRGKAEIIVADIENAAWPLAGRSFDAIVVTNYLWRALLPTVRASLAPAGVLIYETFAQGQQTVGKPSNPAFLLSPGELLVAAEGLHIVAYENGFLSAPERFVQRLVAIRDAPQAGLPPRHALAPEVPAAAPLKSADHEESA
jgi:SAM-dependent methyltransferase